MDARPTLSYRPIRGGWNDPITEERDSTSRFRGKVDNGDGRMVTRNVPLRKTEAELIREAGMLGASDVIIELDLPPDAFYADATGIKANRRSATFPGVIVHLVGTRFGDLRYACDRFECKWSGEPEGWEANLRAVTLGLEALRRVERYGIARRGEQYTGFGALPPGTPLGAPAQRAPMTLDEAARRLAAAVDGLTPQDVLAELGDAKTAYRLASKRLHPDNLHTGDAEAFRTLSEAWDLIEAHHAASAA